MARVVLVVPCFNEAVRLRSDDFLRASLPGHQLTFHFVDDGSTDATSQVLAALAVRAPGRVSHQCLPQNRGKAEAVRAGMLAVLNGEHDYVGYWDADLSTPLDELPPFVEALEARPDIDVVFGARVALLGRRIERKFYRHAYGRVFATAVSRLLRLPVYDTQCGAKLFRVTAGLAEVFREPFLSRWIFDVEILVRLAALYQARAMDVGDRMVEVPLRVWSDVAGSKVGLRDAARAFVELGLIGRRHQSTLDARRSR